MKKGSEETYRECDALLSMKTVFKNVRGHGDLMLEFDFLSYDGQPILFICKNEAGGRFLCSCCKLSYEWVITPVTMEEIQKLLDGDITIRDAFMKPNKTIFATWTGSALYQSYYIPEDALPEKNFYLTSCAEANRDYRKIIGYFGPVYPEISFDEPHVFDPDADDGILAWHRPSKEELESNE